MTQWYYRRHGRQRGPFSPKQFKQLAVTGAIQPTDEIRKGDMVEWVPGTKIEGLFPRTPVAPPFPEEGGNARRKGARATAMAVRGVLIAAAVGLAVVGLGIALGWRH